MFDEKINLFDLNLYYDFVNNNFLNKNINSNFLLKPCNKITDVIVTIPDLNLPSTYFCKSIRINYKIIFMLNYIKVLNNNKIIHNTIHEEKELKIIPFIYTFDDNYSIPIIINNYTKINHKSIYGILYYSLFMPYKSYIPGDNIHLELIIENLINVNNYILIVKIKLKKQLIFTKFFDYIENNDNILTYCKKILCNKNNNTIIKFNDLQIPHNCNYSILSESTNNIFELKYVLKINMFILKNGKLIPLKESSIPIIIGSYRSNYKKIDNLPLLPKYEI